MLRDSIRLLTAMVEAAEMGRVELIPWPSLKCCQGYWGGLGRLAEPLWRVIRHAANLYLSHLAVLRRGKASSRCCSTLMHSTLLLLLLLILMHSALHGHLHGQMVRETRLRLQVRLKQLPLLLLLLLLWLLLMSQQLRLLLQLQRSCD